MEAALRALGEPNRLAIHTFIRAKQLPASQIAEHFKTKRSAVSQHLRVLSDAGLVAERREGTKRTYRLRPEGFRRLRKFLDTFWDEKFGLLKQDVEMEARRRRER
jgi:DNA-binding transcriptional ArsR family regulator